MGTCGSFIGRARLSIAVVTLAAYAATAAAAAAAQVVIPAATPTRQVGSTGPDRKPAATAGGVLGSEWGSRAGHFAEYAFDQPAPLTPAAVAVRYARQYAGDGALRVTVDGADVGTLRYTSTGGWGDNPGDFATATLVVPAIAAGRHALRLTVVADAATLRVVPKPHPVLDRVGHRADKNTVGHGRNVAVYTGAPSKVFFATHELGDVFSAVDGRTVTWRPDQVVVDGGATAGDPRPNVNLDQITVGPPGAVADPPPTSASPDVIDQRQVCVTEDDVIVSRVSLTNTTGRPVTYALTVTGDCRSSFDWRGHPGGRKTTVQTGAGVLVTDHNVYPGILPDGLAMAVGGRDQPTAVDAATPGRYALTYAVPILPRATVTRLLACAIDPSAEAAAARLDRVLADPDPITTNTDRWADFFDRQVPRFDSSDPGLDELYGLRWFLLKFSTAGGDLGLFKYPVCMEGREAFQTYCCYSAPFMAFDLNWAADPAVGFGQAADMAVAAYPDGRFPWYCSPRTNRVPLDHRSGTGQSLLPWTAWRHFVVHGRRDLLAQVYPAMRRNVDWWLADRDPRHVGLFEIDHQLETGMDDLHRRWRGPKPARYQAVDATCYTILNPRAVANMARTLGDTAAARTYADAADRAAHALNTLCWDATLQRYRDRNPDTGELSDYNCITTFYPLMAGVAGPDQLPMIDRYLTNPDQYALPFPVPALSKSDPEFDPDHRYWAGLTWPATNSHVAEGYLATAKRLDRSRLPRAAELFRQVARLHLQPRADFYEHYDPRDGRPLSTFRDYMHSWWVDAYVRHVAGLEVADDGSLTVDPIPLGLTRFALRNAAIRGRSVDVLFNSPDPGLTVRIDGRVIIRRPEFLPGGPPVSVP